MKLTYSSSYLILFLYLFSYLIFVNYCTCILIVVVTFEFIYKNYSEFRVNSVIHFYLFFVPFLSYLILSFFVLK